MTELEIRLAEKLLEIDGKLPDFNSLTELGKQKWKARVDAVLEITNSKYQQEAQKVWSAR